MRERRAKSLYMSSRRSISMRLTRVREGVHGPKGVFFLDKPQPIYLEDYRGY